MIQAWLLGDIARLHFSKIEGEDQVDHSSGGNDDATLGCSPYESFGKHAEHGDHSHGNRGTSEGFVGGTSEDFVGAQEGQGIDFVLGHSFGKITEEAAPAPRRHDASRHPIIVGSSDLRCLQLSLEEAFYLAHVDSCLALAVMSVPATPAAMNALPSRPKHVLDQNEDEKQEPMSEDGLREEDAPLTWESLGLPSCVVRDTSGGTRDDTPTLTAEQAWQYCCARRSSFPAMFAVYRHFRDQGRFGRESGVQPILMCCRRGEASIAEQKVSTFSELREVDGINRFTVKSGHKYGAHFVLYEGPPEECHSRYCVHVMGEEGGGGGDSWSHMKTVTRLMPDVAKCLLVCGVTYGSPPVPSRSLTDPPSTRLPEGSSVTVARRPSPPQAVDTSSLAAMYKAEVTALSFARSSDTESGTARDKSGKSNSKIAAGVQKTSQFERESGSSHSVCVQNPTKKAKRD